MPDPLIDPTLADSTKEPVILAVRAEGPDSRVTASHTHARGQLLGAVRGLITVGARAGQWVVPAIHAVWIPPHHPHSLRTHGPFAGWSVYVAEASCTGLPKTPCAMRVTGLLREAVMRAATWRQGARDELQMHLAGVILGEINLLPPAPFGLPMPTDPRLVRIARSLIADLSDNRSLESWAIRVGMAPRTVTRRFPLETGFSFTVWRQRARLMRALELLAAGVPVTTIAFDLGYETAGAFSALFRRHFGTTPTEYLASEVAEAPDELL